LAILTEKAIEETYKLARPGDAVETVKRNAMSAIAKFGADRLNFCLFDLFSSKRLATEIKIGDVFRIDLSGDFRGYFSDLTRLAVVGKPEKKLLDAYKKYIGVYREIMEMMRPGKRMCDVYEFYQRRFKEEGVIPRAGSHIGHSLGTTHHEYPMISSAIEEQLVPNMVIDLEPCAFFPDLGGCRIQVEDTIRITNDKPEVLSTYANTDELYIVV